ncbi:ribosome hibernation-promoting factor, HPF/YfiA family [Candidatus Odyssella thessalonicensis]|uniref:ribosome hibernation-promoting factor, HPF/YfiA family n=1 Tax=Candidatus Odyssella thessalonicensis TaxID=84647 RepID=UPI000225C158|nr:ribosome-associated translation inhibitor RaiA [Candidatus Odyssella thessalonicensis]
MEIIITGKHLEMGDSLKAHIEKAVTDMVKKHFGDVLEAHVNLSKTPAHNFETDLSFHISRHFAVRTKAEDSDPYRCFDHALEKMYKRTHKYRERLRDTKRHESAVEKEHLPALTYVLNAEAEDTNQDNTPIIIAEMNSVVPTVSVSDAVMHMDLMDQPAMMFKNVNSGRMNVVFRRQDGNIGWIDPS